MLQPLVKPRTAVSWGLPVIIWASSISMLVAGFWFDTALFVVGFVLIATSVLVTLMAFGAATAVIDIPRAPSSVPMQKALLNEAHGQFFPKGAISFFIALILFFGGSWLALYALMIHRGSNL